jgi:hypothetical protein
MAAPPDPSVSAYHQPPADAAARQRRAALDRANETRHRRAALKADLRAGRVSFAELLERPPAWLRSASVYELLLEVPRVGRSRANTALSHAGVSAAATFGSITLPGRLALLDELSRSPARGSL